MTNQIQTFIESGLEKLSQSAKKSSLSGLVDTAAKLNIASLSIPAILAAQDTYYAISSMFKYDSEILANAIPLGIWLVLTSASIIPTLKSWVYENDKYAPVNKFPSGKTGYR